MKTTASKKSSAQPQSEGYKAGLAMRKKVLGDDYVERSFANADDLNMPFQELATEFAWGKVWTRPGLTLKERSLATLSMCIALNRPAEIKIHLRGAVRNGVSRTELRELILHSFLYCGGPAALDTYKAVRDELPLIDAAEKEAKKLARPIKTKTVKSPVKTSAQAKVKAKPQAPSAAKVKT